MTKDKVKNILKNNTCSNCRFRTNSDFEIENYRAMWKEDPPYSWCEYFKEKPKDNTCTYHIEESFDLRYIKEEIEDEYEYNSMWAWSPEDEELI